MNNTIAFRKETFSTSAKSAKLLIEDIVSLSELTLSEIATECHISLRELHRLMDDEVDDSSSRVFNKLLCFYCFIYCHKNGYQITEERVH